MERRDVIHTVIRESGISMVVQNASDGPMESWNLLVSSSKIAWRKFAVLSVTQCGAIDRMVEQDCGIIGRTLCHYQRDERT